MPLGRPMEVGLMPWDFMLDGDPAPPCQKGGGAPPQFSAHVYCGQTAGWIKMPLGTEVGLDLGDIVLDRDPAPPSLKRGRSPPPEREAEAGAEPRHQTPPMGGELVAQAHANARKFPTFVCW